MKTSMHKTLDIKSALLNWPLCKYENMMKTKSGEMMEAIDVKAYFIQCLCNGIYFLPFGNYCDMFDNKLGCQGHEDEVVEDDHE